MGGELADPTHEWMHEWYRGKIEHEDLLIVERISWLLTSEAFLFVAYVILFTIPAEGLFAHSRVKELFVFIPVVALVCDLVASVSVWAAISAYQRARAEFEDYEKQLRQRNPEWRCGLELTAQPITRLLGKAAAVGVPVILLGAWIWLLTMAP